MGLHCYKLWLNGPYARVNFPVYEISCCDNNLLVVSWAIIQNISIITPVIYRTFNKDRHKTHIRMMHIVVSEYRTKNIKLTYLYACVIFKQEHPNFNK